MYKIGVRSNTFYLLELPKLALRIYPKLGFRQKYQRLRMRSVIIENDYDVSSERLWALATDYQALNKVMEGKAVFEGLPQGRTITGQKMTLMVSPLGKLPKKPYVIEILECDDQRRVLRSFEYGLGVKSWRHTLTVKTLGSGSQLRDEVEIEAGVFTPFFALWAKHIYQARHKPRLKLIEHGCF